jgi:hypothetical protein
MHISKPMPKFALAAILGLVLIYSLMIFSYSASGVQQNSKSNILLSASIWASIENVLRIHLNTSTTTTSPTVLQVPATTTIQCTCLSTYFLGVCYNNDWSCLSSTSSSSTASTTQSTTTIQNTSATTQQVNRNRTAGRPGQRSGVAIAPLSGSISATQTSSGYYITESISGGQAPYNITEYASTTYSYLCPEPNSYVDLQVSGVTSSSYSITSGFPSSTTYICAIVNDSSGQSVQSGPATIYPQPTTITTSLTTITTTSTSTSTSTIPIVPALSASISSTSLGAGNYQLTESISGGKPPYTITMYASSSTTCGEYSHSYVNLQVSGVTSSTYSITSGTPTSTTYYCALVNDSSGQSVLTGVTSIAGVIPTSTLSASISAVPSTLNSTWPKTTLTVLASGGTAPYQIAVYSSSSSSCPISTEVNQTPNVYSYASFSQQPTASTYYCAYVIDSSGHSYTTTPVLVTVNKPSTLSATVSVPSSVAVNQYFPVTVNMYGGTSPYTLYIYSSTSSSCSSASSTLLNTSRISGSSASFSEKLTSKGFYYYWVNAFDSSNPQQAVYAGCAQVFANGTNASKSTSLTAYISSTLKTVNSTWPQTALTINFYGGTPPFYTTLYSSPTSSCSTSSTRLNSSSGYAGTSAGYYILFSQKPTSPTYYCAYVTDSAGHSSLTSPVFVNFTKSNQFTALISTQQPVLAVGQKATIYVGSFYDGTPPYSINLYSSSTSSCSSSSTPVNSTSGVSALAASVYFTQAPLVSTYYCAYVTDSAGHFYLTPPIFVNVTKSNPLSVSLTAVPTTLNATWPKTTIAVDFYDTGTPPPYFITLYSSPTSSCSTSSTQVNSSSSSASGYSYGNSPVEYVGAVTFGQEPYSSTYYCAYATDPAGHSSLSLPILINVSRSGASQLSASISAVPGPGRLSSNIDIIWSGGKPPYNVTLMGSQVDGCSSSYSNSSYSYPLGYYSTNSMTAQSSINSIYSYYCALVRDSSNPPQISLTQPVKNPLLNATGSTPPTTDVPINSNGTCPSGYISDPNFQGYCKPTPPTTTTICTGASLGGTCFGTSPLSAIISVSPATTAPNLPINVTVSLSGGKNPYSINVYASPNSSCSTNSLSVSQLSINGTFWRFAQSPSGPTYYCAYIQDSSTPQKTFLTGTAHILVNLSSSSTPLHATINANPTSIIAGQGTTISISWSGSGISPYRIKLYSSPTYLCSSSSNEISNVTSAPVNAGNGTSFGEGPTTSTYYCAYVTDSSNPSQSAYTGWTFVKVNSSSSGSHNQYYLYMNSTLNTSAVVTPSTGYYTAGSAVPISASQCSNGLCGLYSYVFSGWIGYGTGSYTGTNSSAIVLMNGNITEIAVYSQCPLLLFGSCFGANPASTYTSELSNFTSAYNQSELNTNVTATTQGAPNQFGRAVCKGGSLSACNLLCNAVPIPALRQKCINACQKDCAPTPTTPPTISINPTTQSAGGTVSITATCPGSDTCLVTDPAGTVVPPGSKGFTGSSFSFSFTVSSSAPGGTMYTYKVTDKKTSLSSTASYTVTYNPPTISISPSTSVKTGSSATTPIKLTATCQSGDTCIIVENQNNPCGNSFTGTTTCDISSYASSTAQPGSYIFVVTDKSTQAQNNFAQATLTVISGTSVSITPPQTIQQSKTQSATITAYCPGTDLCAIYSPDRYSTGGAQVASNQGSVTYTATGLTSALSPYTFTAYDLTAYPPDFVGPIPPSGQASTTVTVKSTSTSSGFSPMASVCTLPIQGSALLEIGNLTSSGTCTPINNQAACTSLGYSFASPTPGAPAMCISTSSTTPPTMTFSPSSVPNDGSTSVTITTTCPGNDVCQVGSGLTSQYAPDITCTGGSSTACSIQASSLANAKPGIYVYQINDTTSKSKLYSQAVLTVTQSTTKPSISISPTVITLGTTSNPTSATITATCPGITSTLNNPPSWAIKNGYCSISDGTKYVTQVNVPLGSSSPTTVTYTATSPQLGTGTYTYTAVLSTPVLYANEEAWTTTSSTPATLTVGNPSLSGSGSFTPPQMCYTTGTVGPNSEQGLIAGFMANNPGGNLNNPNQDNPCLPVADQVSCNKAFGTFSWVPLDSNCQPDPGACPAAADYNPVTTQCEIVTNNCPTGQAAIDAKTGSIYCAGQASSAEQLCYNDATNPPDCNQCSTGETYNETSGNCEVSSTPAPTTTISSTECDSECAGASDFNTCFSCCQNGQVYDQYYDECV